MINEGDIVQVNKAPMGCCGVLKVGWFGTVVTIINLYNKETEKEENILILDDNTLAWEHECSLHPTKNISTFKEV